LELRVADQPVCGAGRRRKRLPAAAHAAHRSTAPNLWDLCPPFQIDGNFGGTAGIANMLLLDRGGEVRLLPALPKAFANGSARGLRITATARSTCAGTTGNW
jgi:hypothetical protein